MSTKTPPHFATRAIHAGQSPDPSTGAVMQPIYATSTYVQSSPGVHKGYEYSRSQNPTRFAYERCVADLESGRQGYAFASGLAATATLLDTLEPGAHVIASDDMYGGTYRLFARVREKSAGLKFSYVDMREPNNVEAAITPQTRLIWVETPTNPMLKLVDLSAIAAIAKKHGVLAAADNTFASPYVQRPLEHGFGLVMHSATKYLNGHSDVVNGVLVVGEDAALRPLPSRSLRRSRPAQNALPLPVRITTRTFLSSLASVKSRARSFSIGPEIVFMRSGAFSVMVAM